MDWTLKGFYDERIAHGALSAHKQICDERGKPARTQLWKECRPQQESQAGPQGLFQKQAVLSQEATAPWVSLPALRHPSGTGCGRGESGTDDPDPKEAWARVCVCVSSFLTKKSLKSKKKTMIQGCKERKYFCTAEQRVLSLVLLQKS